MWKKKVFAYMSFGMPQHFLPFGIDKGGFFTSFICVGFSSSFCVRRKWWSLPLVFGFSLYKTQNNCSLPNLYAKAPLQPYSSSHDCLLCFVFLWCRIWESCQTYGRFNSWEWDLRELLHILKHMSVRCFITQVRFYQFLFFKSIHVSI